MQRISYAEGASFRATELDMLPTLLWKPIISQRVQKALAECSRSDLQLHDLQVICLSILSEIRDDRQTQYQIVASRIEANDQAGVQWLLADPRRFPACYVHGPKVSNGLEVAARHGHIDLLKWLALDKDAKYWSDIRKDWVLCDVGPDTLIAAVEGGDLDVVKEVAWWFSPDKDDECRSDIHAAVEGADLEVASWFSGTQPEYEWKQDVGLTYQATAAVCQHYLEQKQQGEDATTWQNGKHFEVLAWLREEGVSWDKRSMGEAAKAGHLELIDWLSADGGIPKQRCMQSTFACTMAIHNPYQDQAIRTLEHLLNCGFPWKPITRGFGKKKGSNRQYQAENAGLCETAASLGRLKVLKWLAQDPHALLPLCKDSFEMRQDATTRKAVSTGIPLTPWEDGNSPSWIRDAAKKGLAGKDLTERAKEIGLPENLMHKVTLAAFYGGTAEHEAKQGSADAAAQYQGLAAQVDDEIQEYKETLAWLDSPESGYLEHVQQQWEHYLTLRRSLGIPDKPKIQQQSQQQQQAANTSAAAAVAAAATVHPPGRRVPGRGRGNNSRGRGRGRAATMRQQQQHDEMQAPEQSGGEQASGEAAAGAAAAAAAAAAGGGVGGGGGVLGLGSSRDRAAAERSKRRRSAADAATAW